MIFNPQSFFRSLETNCNTKKNYIGHNPSYRTTLLSRTLSLSFGYAISSLPANHMPADNPTINRTIQQQEYLPNGIISALNTSTKDQNQPQQSFPFEKQLHHPSHCNIIIVSLLQAKRTLVQEQYLCLNCLGSHFVKDCSSRNVNANIYCLTRR